MRYFASHNFDLHEEHFYRAPTDLPITLFAQGDCLKTFSGLSQIHEFSETDRLLLISSNQGLFVIDKAKLEVIN